MGASHSTPLALELVEEIQQETGFTKDEIQRLYRRFERLDKDGCGTISTDEFLSIPELAMNPLAMRVIALFANDHRYIRSDVRPTRPTKGGSDTTSASDTTESIGYGTPEISEGEVPLHSSFKVARDSTPETSETEDSSSRRRSSPSDDDSSSVYGTDGGGVSGDEVNFRQFVRTLAVFRPQAHVEDKIMFAFRVYDIRGDGYIAHEELHSILHMLVGDNMTTEQLTAVVAKTVLEADTTGDNRISFDEFKACLSPVDVHARMSIKFP